MLYIDSDGVLADWVGWMLDYHNLNSVEELNNNRGLIREAYLKVPNVFDVVKVLPNACALISELRARNIDFTILTAVGPDTPHPTIVYEDKLKFFKREFDIDSSDVVITQNSADKQVYANRYSMLIDDYYKNCNQWVNAGGTAIHVPDGITSLDILMQIEDFFDVSNQSKIPKQIAV